eukprot:jgi/Botrbrau1/5968/Bobra.0366s0135.4
MRKFPKAVLHEFYQVHEGNPVFSVEAHSTGGPPRFRCTLLCPEVSVGSITFPQTSFTADARSKKEAEHAASEKALSALRQLGMCTPNMAPSPLAATGPPFISRDELEYLKQRLLVLSAQLEVEQIQRRHRGTLQRETIPEGLDIDNLSLQEARAMLRTAVNEKQDLLHQLNSLRSRNQLMLSILADTHMPTASAPESTSSKDSLGSQD